MLKLRGLLRVNEEVKEVSAIGGEGGGVLSGWIVAAAQNAGFPVQSTSIPGVAQRTGATVYYLEVFLNRWNFYLPKKVYYNIFTFNPLLDLIKIHSSNFQYILLVKLKEVII